MSTTGIIFDVWAVMIEGIVVLESTDDEQSNFRLVRKLRVSIEASRLFLARVVAKLPTIDELQFLASGFF